MKTIPYIYNNTEICTLSHDLQFLYDVFKKSEYILDLQSGFDKDGYILPYTAPSFEIWKKSILFVCKYANEIYGNFGKIIELPSIYHNQLDGIDILWDMESYTFMISIDETKNTLFCFTHLIDNNVYCNGSFNTDDFNINLLPLAITLKTKNY